MPEKNEPGRRGFLKTLTLAGGLTSDAAGGWKKEPAKPVASAPAANSPRIKAAFSYPREFRDSQLAMIAFPLGGVASGSISLGGRGQLRDWEVFNKPDKGRTLSYAFPSIFVDDGRRRWG